MAITLDNTITAIKAAKSRDQKDIAFMIFWNDASAVYAAAAARSADRSDEESKLNTNINQAWSVYILELTALAETSSGTELDYLRVFLTPWTRTDALARQYKGNDLKQRLLAIRSALLGLRATRPGPTIVFEIDAELQNIDAVLAKPM